jgi:fused signal recognition particle receptor
LVLDANTGQNGLTQFNAFHQAVGLTGLILTKLDGSAKGGIIAAIAASQAGRERQVPIAFIGVGEGMDDLRPFVARDFVDALLA